MQETEGGGKEPAQGGGRHVPLSGSQAVAGEVQNCGTLFHISKHAKSLHAQIEAARRSVLSQTFSLTEQTSGGGEKERLDLVQSGFYSLF